MDTVQLAHAIGDVPFKVLDSLRTIEVQQFLAPSLSSGRSLRDVLVHMLVAEQNWIGHVAMKRDISFAEEEDFCSVDDIECAWRPLREDTIRFLETVTEDELRTVIADEYEPHIHYSVEMVVWHWLTHEFFHWGELCQEVGQSGIKVYVPEAIS